MSRSRRSAVFAIALVCFAVAPVGVATAAAKPSAGADQATAAKQKPTVNRRVYRRFRVLHRKQRARLSDVIVLPAFPAQFGIVTGAARTVATKTGVTVAIVPGSSGTCISVTSAPSAPQPTGVECAPTATTLAGKQWDYSWTIDGAPGGTLVGIAPDNDVAAQVTLSDGSLERVPIVNNVWAINGAGPGGPSNMPFNRVQVQDDTGKFTTAYAGK